jgi:pimeloyl-ACP methyl ester carboxylesterase
MRAYKDISAMQVLLSFIKRAIIKHNIHSSFYRRLHMLFAAKLAIGLAALIGTGSLYQKIETQRDLIKYPPIGKMVNVGTHAMHIIETGEKKCQTDPTIIFDGGLANPALDWSLVQPEVAAFARVCSYDRSGYGWSEASPAERTSSNMVEELHTLLHNGGIEPPYILVGHSFGGINVQLFAHMYPEEVAGLLLVEPAHEDQIEETPQPIAMAMYVLEKGLKVAAWIAPCGIIRLCYQRLFADAAKRALLAQSFPASILDARIASFCTTKHIREMYQELHNLTKNFSAFKSTPRCYGNIPLVVLSASAEGNRNDLKRYGIEDAATYDAFIVMRTRHFNDLASRSSQGRLIVAQKSGHMMPFEEPGIIVDAIREMVQAIA